MENNIIHLIDESFESKITSYWFWADQFAMINGKKNSENWLMNNFINIRCHKKLLPGGIYFCNTNDYRNKMVEFYNCPFLEMYKIPFDRDTKKIMGKSIIEFAIDRVTNGYFLLFTVERNFLNSNKDTISHTILLHGINLEEKLIYYADNCSITGKYRTDFECSFDELQNAYLAFNVESDTEEPDLCDSVFVFKAIDSLYAIDTYKIRNDIYNYIYPRKDTSISYGIDVTRDMIKYLQNNKNGIVCDIRGFSTIVDHKRAMLYRVEYLTKKLELESLTTDSYNMIFKQSQTILFLFLKYCINRKNDILDEIIQKLQMMYTNEVKILNQLFKVLKQHSTLT